MNYRHRCILTDPTGGGGAPAVQDDDTGGYDPGTPPGQLVVYAGPCDVQDGGFSVPRDATGQPTVVADAMVFLRDETAVEVIRPGQAVTLEYPPSKRSPNGRTKDGAVSLVRELDGSFLVALNKQTAPV